MTAPSLVSSFATLFSISAIPFFLADNKFGNIHKRRGGRTNLEIGDELFYNGLPRDKTFDEDIGWPEVMRGDILLDERLVPRDRRALFTDSRDGRRPRYGTSFVAHCSWGETVVVVRARERALHI